MSTAVKDQDLKTATSTTWPYEFAVLPLGHMFVDESYQRPLSRFVKQIMDNFEPALVGTLVVSKRKEDSYAIIDGQTRFTAMRNLGHMGAPALVYSNLTQEQEAILFARFQSERRNISALERFKAALIGKEPRALTIESMVHGAGMVLEKSNAGNAIMAVKALENIHDQYGEIYVAYTLDIISRAWQHQKQGANSNEMLRGMAYFLFHQDDVNDDKLVRGLSVVDPAELHTRAAQLRQGRGHGGKSPSYMAEAIEATYRRRVTPTA